MTTVEAQAPSVRATQPLQLSLKSRTDCVGETGGTWWPRSRDLLAELPDLLAALADRLGRIERVVYNPAGWAPSVPHQMVVGDATVTLEAYQFELFDKLYAYSIGGTSIVLEVVPAARELSVRDLEEMAAAHSRWDSEGGLLGVRTAVRRWSG